MARLILPAILLLLLSACVPALPPHQPIEANPVEAGLSLVRLEPGLYQTTLLLYAGPAVCVTGRDGALVCTTFVIVGRDLTTQNRVCRVHPTLADALECIVRERLERGFRITFTSTTSPYVVVGFYLERDPSRPRYLTAGVD